MMELSDIQVRVLGIVGSPRKNSNSLILAKEAMKGAKEVSDIETEVYEVYSKSIAPCKSCYGCTKLHYCVQKDDFDEYFEKWLRADGVIYSVPVYVTGLPANVKALIDRTSPVYLSRYPRNNRPTKVYGIITQAAIPMGGQEAALYDLVRVAHFFRCIVASPDRELGSVVGGAVGHCEGSIEKGSIAKDQRALEMAKSLGRRVAELAKITKWGAWVMRERRKLPKEYYVILDDGLKRYPHYPIRPTLAWPEGWP